MSEPVYDEIFKKLVKSSYRGNMAEEIEKIRQNGDEHTDEYIKYASGEGDPNRVVFKVKDCHKDCNLNREDNCEASCLFNAIVRDMEGNVVIKQNNCSGCGKCVEVCRHYSLVDKKEFVPLIELLKNRKVPVFAIVAPAFIGQFGPEVSPGKMRAALKRLGFYGMVEVALFADILTLKEALEFDRHVTKAKDFLLTSCCCPIWVSMVKRVYQDLIPHISPSVSPMVACGRGVKHLHPGAKVVFIGPCIAKKAEAKEPDVSDAVDAVLTFQEVKQIFEAVAINPETMEEDESEHSSTAGRIYAHTGGVSRAVAETLNRLRPQKEIKIRAIQADGVKDCREMLKNILDDKIEANFLEGMGCSGGCVGGPKALIDAGAGRDFVEKYGQEAPSRTPVDNKYVMKLLEQLGIKNVEDFLDGEKAKMFTRNFQ
ncbi:Iron only hydrogenase large subunit, C-terminal domain [Desulfotomaculum arcticum]|uniref:Iron only hydrogenase large subunit, C-terminal domain n=1 Tax=Desulfotruncus arcticus DSM 17038 TaxID=1121424 RepID=A0A1I2UUR8_9FIRM|nr:[Fe-Fe] hydrogenase large subunit C-terminal domain-containing protein [Desulfotruncus arcticus]SFG80915.1 Iron only hydrogenase large subunit, C-terminal domain [Desulfotomaculum arcticum] [Desulfotruncus arcticus DSM 17038]